MSAYINLYIDVGVNFERTLELTNSNGVPTDLTGYYTLAKMRKSFHSGIDVYVINSEVLSPATDGKIRIFLSALQTSQMKPGRYVYDIVISPNTNLGATGLTSNSIVYKKLNGIIQVRPNAVV